MRVGFSCRRRHTIRASPIWITLGRLQLFPSTPAVLYKHGACILHATRAHRRLLSMLFASPLYWRFEEETQPSSLA